MTTTQPPSNPADLKPGDRVYVEMEAVERSGYPIALRMFDSGRNALYFDPAFQLWHRAPGPDGTDDTAETVARLIAAAEAIRDSDSGDIESALDQLDSAVDAYRGALSRPVAAQTAGDGSDEKAPETAPGATLSHQQSGIVPDSAGAPTGTTAGSTADDYARLCREVAMAADQTMSAARTAYSYGANPTHVGDLEEAARRMLALIPDVPPAADTRPQPQETPQGRDWASEIRRVLESLPRETWITDYAEAIVDALGLRDLEADRDRLAGYAKEVQRHRAAQVRLMRELHTTGTPEQVADVAIAHRTSLLLRIEAAERERNDAAGRLDALRAGVADVANAWHYAAGFIRRSHAWTDPDRVAGVYERGEHRLRALLDGDALRPPTTSTDATAETSEGGQR